MPTVVTTPSSHGPYSLQHVAQLLNCSLRHARRLDAQGIIPGRMTFGRLVRFSRRQVDAWLDGDTGQTRLLLRK